MSHRSDQYEANVHLYLFDYFCVISYINYKTNVIPAIVCKRKSKIGTVKIKIFFLNAQTFFLYEMFADLTRFIEHIKPDYGLRTGHQ